MLFKHSKAHIWIALRTDVVGGCDDGAANGGKDRDVGCIRASKGATSVGNDTEADFAAGSSSMGSSPTSIAKSGYVIEMRGLTGR